MACKVEFQRRHFEWLAAVIADWPTRDGDPGETDHVARHFASALAVTNPNFDRAKFLAACGVVDSAS